MAQGGRGSGRAIALGAALAVVAGILAVTAAIFVLGNSGTTGNSSPSVRPPDYCQVAKGAELSLRSLATDATRATVVGDAIPFGAPPDFFSIGNATSWSVSGQSCYEFTVTVAAPHLAVGNTAFEVKTVTCTNVTQQWAVDYLNASGALLATENVGDHTWGNATLVTLSIGDRVLVDSVGPLSADQLESEVNFQGGGGESSVILGSYTGPSEGPCFS